MGCEPTRFRIRWFYVWSVTLAAFAFFIDRTWQSVVIAIILIAGCIADHVAWRTEERGETHG